MQGKMKIRIDSKMIKIYKSILNGTGTSTTEIYIPIWNSLVSSLASGGDTIDLEKVAPLK